MKKIYLAGAYVNEDHVRTAWARVRAGVKTEKAAASVLPASKRINSVTRSAYQSSLISILTLKAQLFTQAFEEQRKGGDWHKVFRGRKSIFWPDESEKGALELTDYTQHEVILAEPHRGRPVKVKMTIDHDKRRVRQAELHPLNGSAR
jgi:hypothetical protein